MFVRFSSKLGSPNLDSIIAFSSRILRGSFIYKPNCFLHPNLFDTRKRIPFVYSTSSRLLHNRSHLRHSRFRFTRSCVNPLPAVFVDKPDNQKDIVYDAKELPSLHEAYIHALVGSTGYNILHSLHNIQVLSLSTSSCFHVPYVVLKIIFAKFLNLTRLRLDDTCIHDATDSLEVLTFEMKFCHAMQQWKSKKRINPGLSRLSSVSLIGFHDRKCNIALAEYILEKAQVLTKMEIRCRSQLSLQDKFNLLQTISEIPRVSPTCKVTFS